MPELPEVETLRKDLEKLYVGHVLKSLSVTGRRTVRRHRPERLSAVQGRKLVAVNRQGKHLLFEWDDGQVLVAHLRMSGQLLAAKRGAPKLPHTHAVFSFAGAPELHFVDPRTFGELFLARMDDAGATQLAHLGPDALAVTPSQLSDALAGRRALLKALLVDQRVLAGIGNIYADEICFEAKLRPDRPGGLLNRRETGRLAKAVRSVLEQAIDARGSSLDDRQYRDVYGEIGGYQLRHRVYGRAGHPCLRCGKPVQRLRIGAKSSYFCATCQH
ncbi:MAG TPA: bifunctional DNA-formamidopyrimidine glycosylase/DNA-(apurinic or apyrimidinic site) lyase [Acidimicrobiales bacterium]|nr:bifunctional DNA-formamidopyrimidine glycosylase/DNA-(apurinic or apyrimidinic site) lyase [Acidimicrobiales bacterium]